MFLTHLEQVQFHVSGSFRADSDSDHVSGSFKACSLSYLWLIDGRLSDFAYIMLIFLAH